VNEKDVKPEPAREGEAFLERWSRLKSEARRDEAPAPVGPDTVPDAQAAAPEAAERSTVVPDLGVLDQDSDYSAFLAADIDPDLRRRALHKLFHSPKFNVLDGLDDYCDDFTQFTPLGAVVTADMRFQLERAARKALAEIEASGPGSEPATVLPAETVAATDSVGAAADADTTTEEKPIADDDTRTA
jgi:hypothetical protein